jgi:hypothetical protein
MPLREERVSARVSVEEEGDLPFEDEHQHKEGTDNQAIGRNQG